MVAITNPLQNSEGNLKGNFFSSLTGYTHLRIAIYRDYYYNKLNKYFP